MQQQLEFDPDLIRRYDTTGPRYTSYPTAIHFTDDFGSRDYRDAAARSHLPAGGPLSLYFHIPFCATVCYYCACTKVITKNRSRAEAYVDHLVREIELQGRLFDGEREVVQLHWGGGTPTFLSGPEMRRLMRETRKNFNLRDDDSGEYSIEIDPRQADVYTISLLRGIGFNRLSLGVQDFDPRVQKAVNRVQSPDETFEVMAAARITGFQSVNIDLIYGLPHQGVDSFLATLDAVIAAEPDRLAIFNYAHLPQMFKVQRQIDEAALPNAETKLRILGRTIERLTQAGYVFIGMDHFAKPDDELAQAQRAGSLTRNFQGYTTHAGCDLIGMGMSSISKIDNCYSQNVKDISEYQGRLAAGELAVARGLCLSEDDRVRRAVINQLICHFELDFDTIERDYEIDFRRYFAAELRQLESLAEDGLLTLDDDRVQIAKRGRLLVRNVCMVFDRYLRQPNGPARYSRVI